MPLILPDNSWEKIFFTSFHGPQKYLDHIVVKNFRCFGLCYQCKPWKSAILNKKNCKYPQNNEYEGIIDLSYFNVAKCRFLSQKPSIQDQSLPLIATGLSSWPN